MESAVSSAAESNLSSEQLKDALLQPQSRDPAPPASAAPSSPPVNPRVAPLSSPNELAPAPEPEASMRRSAGESDKGHEASAPRGTGLKRKAGSSDLEVGSSDSEEQPEEKNGSADEGDADETTQHEWVRFIAMDEENVSVLWANDELTHEPLSEFQPQIEPMLFACHKALLKWSPEEQRDILEQMAKSSPKAAAGERKPRATSSHQKKQKKAKKLKQARGPPKQSSDRDGLGVDSIQSELAGIHISKTTCSYCGSVCVLCFHCTATASCSQRVCTHCWTLATAALEGMSTTPRSAPIVPNHFHCHQHGGAIPLPIHPTVQKYGLPSDEPQSIDVWSSATSFPAYRSQLDTPLLKAVPLSSEGLSSGQRPAAVVLEYHSDVHHGNVVFDPPMRLSERGAAASACMEPDISQAAMLSRFIDPESTKLVALLTCGPYRKQLEAIRAASQSAYPNTTFLLFDIEQLFVRDILSAVCSTVRQSLLYPHASPLHLAAEHFGKRLVQAYRPSFLFRGELLQVVHHSQDALTQCACGVTLKSRGLVHRAAGWEAFERFQLYRYTCKKAPGCGLCMLLPRC